MPTNTLTRILIATVALALIYGGLYWVREGGEPARVVPLAWDLEEIPLMLGGWDGQETELDRQVFLAVGADAVVDRHYEDAAGNRLSLHVASFSRWPDQLRVPHEPLICYTNAGWRVPESRGIKTVELELKDGTRWRVRQLSATQDGQRSGVRALYWYQVGGQVVLDRDDLRQARWPLRGKSEWPSLVKVLIQAPATTLRDEDQSGAIEDFAVTLLNWMNETGRQPITGSPVL
jgi:EpsI family protein